jgi:Beta-lactamase
VTQCGLRRSGSASRPRRNSEPGSVIVLAFAHHLVGNDQYVEAYKRPSPDSTGLVVAELHGAVQHHARWHQPTEAETAAAVAELHEILAGRDDGPRLLAQVAGLLTGSHALTATSLPPGAGMPAPFVHGYDVAPPQAPEDVTHLFAAGWAWAAGGIVSTIDDANTFIRAYVCGATTSPPIRMAQFEFRPGSSEPPGPGQNSAGLGIFRYQTRYGTVYGHTGNTPGYTQFIAASANGRRSVVVSANSQITPTTNLERFTELRQIYTLAVAAALARQ